MLRKLFLIVFSALFVLAGHPDGQWEKVQEAINSEHFVGGVTAVAIPDYGEAHRRNAVLNQARSGAGRGECYG